MRAFLVLIATLCVAGCSNSDWANVVTYVGEQSGFAGDTTARPEPAAAAMPLNPRCQDIATERAADTAEQGFDEDTRNAVYKRAYAECVAWQARGSDVVAR